MKRRGDTRAAAAAEMDISTSMLSDLLTGRPRNYSMYTLKKICEYGHFSADRILGLSEPADESSQLQTVSYVTGLSPKAAEMLGSYNRNWAVKTGLVEEFAKIEQNTVNRLLEEEDTYTLLSSLMLYFVKMDIVRQEPNYFQPADIVRIREALQTEPLKWRTITELLIITGCRRGEIMGPRWNRVDFQRRTIRIDTNLLYSPKRGIYKSTTKTEGSVRTINLPAETMELLKEYQHEYIELRQKMGDQWHETGFLFVKEDGTPMIPDSITAWLRIFCCIKKYEAARHVNTFLKCEQPYGSAPAEP